MKLIGISRGEATVTMAEEEVSLLWHAIHEALNAVRRWEFKTRTGARPENAEDLMRQLEDITERIVKHDSQPKA
ncbi:MAG TPA: hypothetical protein VFB13_02055 [Reyranella sp.]|jgi:hypothetical protein|nr:hypothetical protein [Reyranella sp.]